MKALLLFLTLIMAGCTKVELDPSTLNDNPFDRQYTGGSVFSFTGHQFYTVISGSEEVQRMRIFVNIDRSRFNSDGVYRVRYRVQNFFGYTYLQHTELSSGTFELIVNEPITGETKCWELALGNGNEFPNVFELCYTIP